MPTLSNVDLGVSVVTFQLVTSLGSDLMNE